MRLRDLEAEFVRLLGLDGSLSFIGQHRINAQGLWFLCPKCFEGEEHHILCWFAGVPSAISPKPGRWNPSGSIVDDLTFVGPGSTSVLITAGCRAHFHITNGSITLC